MLFLYIALFEIALMGGITAAAFYCCNPLTLKHPIEYGSDEESDEENDIIPEPINCEEESCPYEKNLEKNTNILREIKGKIEEINLLLLEKED